MKHAFLVDTNHISALINPVSRVRERLFQAHRTGARFRTCVPIICEVEVGIQDSSHVESYRRQLKQLTRKVKLIPLDVAIAQQYGEIFRELRRVGRPMSQVDMMLAALARHTGWTSLPAIVTSKRYLTSVRRIGCSDPHSPPTSLRNLEMSLL
jgi:predicted nucleic acid-binding protein